MESWRRMEDIPAAYFVIRHSSFVIRISLLARKTLKKNVMQTGYNYLWNQPRWPG